LGNFDDISIVLVVKTISREAFYVFISRKMNEIRYKFFFLPHWPGATPSFILNL